MKQLVKSILRRFGIIAMKRSSRVYIADDESYRIVVERCGITNPVIIDGGAHRGDSVRAFSDLVPQAEFHCFEPDPSLVGELKESFTGKDNIHIVAAALGEDSGRSVFNINASRPTNSLLPIADGLQDDLKALCQVVERVDVEVVSIDDYCGKRGLQQIDILKLDLQGYDYKALLGAKSTLQAVRVVLVEVLFTEIYKGCHLFPDILRLMLNEGFTLYTLCGIHYGNNHELLWADAIFVRRNASR